MLWVRNWVYAFMVSIQGAQSPPHAGACVSYVDALVAARLVQGGDGACLRKEPEGGQRPGEKHVVVSRWSALLEKHARCL